MPRVDRRAALGLGVLLALSAGCVRSGHSDHTLWLELQERSPASSSALSVHPNRTAIVVTAGAARADGTRDPGSSFDDSLSEPELQRLLQLLEPAQTALYRRDSATEDEGRAADSVRTLTIDAQVPDAPSDESLRLSFVAGKPLRAETRALLRYLTELEQRISDRGAR